jgi:hypothetical protein
LSAPPAAGQPQQEQPQAQSPEQKEQQKELDKLLDGVDPNKLPEETQEKLKDLLQLPQLPPLPNVLPPLAGGGSPNASAPSGSTTSNLLDFLLG